MSVVSRNMASGRVLKRLTLRETFSRSLCIRGYSSHGALFVLMQQQQMQGSVQGPGAEAEQEQARLSLVAMNPLNGKSVLVTDLCVPDQWSGRRSAVTAVDVLGSLLLGLSDEGGVCVWDLERPTDPRPVCAPGGRRGWHVARWGAPGLLLTALNAGDVTLHRYAHGTATVMLTLTHPD